MTTKMSEWLIEQMIALESGTLDEYPKALILSFLIENVEDTHIMAAFEKFKEIQKENDEHSEEFCDCVDCNYDEDEEKNLPEFVKEFFKIEKYKIIYD